MFTPLFWFFAALTLLFGIGVVANRNPVASALCLVISFMGLASLFVGLDAYLIAILQVLVYAGAVMVLFLFIIMLLDLRAESRRKFNWLGIVGGGLVTLGFIAELSYVISQNQVGNQKFPALGQSAEVCTECTEGAAPATAGAPVPPGSITLVEAPAAHKIDDVREIGSAIFTNYNLPLQIVGVLVLVATVGVVILSRKELK